MEQSISKRVKESLQYFKIWLSRKIDFPLCPPQGIIIPLTRSCNLQCVMCNIRGSKAEDLDSNTMFGLINEAVSMGIGMAILTGGEPLLREDIFDICKFCRERKMAVILSTNGTLINAHIARQLLSSGVTHVNFSLDGLEQTHDSIRGQGSFRKTTDGIKHLAEARAETGLYASTGIACAITNRNLEDLSGLMDLADQLRVDIINFIPLLKDNAHFITGEPGETLWIPEDRLPMLDNAINSIKSCRKKYTRLHEDTPLHLFKKYYRNTLSMKDWKCFGGFKYFLMATEIDREGSVNCYVQMGCHRLEDIGKMGLNELWRSKKAREIRKKLRRCTKPCLQPCQSISDAESLLHIAKMFIA